MSRSLNLDTLAKLARQANPFRKAGNSLSNYEPGPEPTETALHPLEVALARLQDPERLSRDDLEAIIGYAHMERFNLHRYGTKLFDKEKTDALSREIMIRVRRIISRRGYEPFTRGTLSFVASYPRSGNTLAMGSLAKLGPVQNFSNLAGAPNYIATECFPPNYPFFRIVKSHQIPPYASSNKYIFIVRDGRDVLPSIAYMTLQQGMHEFEKKSQLKDFIDWQQTNYKFGDWPSFVQRMLALKDRKNVLIVKYEDLTRHKDELAKMADFLGLRASSEAIEEAFESRDRILEGLKANNRSNVQWGIGVSDFTEDSLYYAWSRNRSGSTWRETMDAAARLKFHEMGGTEVLIELGYESDPTWYAK